MRRFNGSGNCEKCGSFFTGKRTDTRYCSASCRQRAFDERTRDSRLATQRAKRAERVGIATVYGPSVRERFFNKVQVDPGSGCWCWIGHTQRGYGRFSVDGVKTSQKAHRVSYELHVGPIPVGLTLDHLCRNRSCVNPAHLEPVTLAENIRRAARARREQKAIAA